MCSKYMGRRCFGVREMSWALKNRLDLDYVELEREANPVEYKGLEARSRVYSKHGEEPS